jgi:hypothetical protein
MMSFPKAGPTLALDFANDGERTMRLFRELTAFVRSIGGRLYPAKDSTMTSEDFREFYPQYRDFSRYIDEKFSSTFWRRVQETA